MIPVFRAGYISEGKFFTPFYHHSIILFQEIIHFDFLIWTSSLKEPPQTLQEIVVEFDYIFHWVLFYL